MGPNVERLRLPYRVESHEEYVRTIRVLRRQIEQTRPWEYPEGEGSEVFCELKGEGGERLGICWDTVTFAPKEMPEWTLELARYVGYVRWSTLVFQTGAFWYPDEAEQQLILLLRREGRSDLIRAWHEPFPGMFQPGPPVERSAAPAAPQAPRAPEKTSRQQPPSAITRLSLKARTLKKRGFSPSTAAYQRKRAPEEHGKRAAAGGIYCEFVLKGDFALRISWDAVRPKERQELYYTWLHRFWAVIEIGPLKFRGAYRWAPAQAEFDLMDALLLLDRPDLVDRWRSAWEVPLATDSTSPPAA